MSRINASCVRNDAVCVLAIDTDRNPRVDQLAAENTELSRRLELVTKHAPPASTAVHSHALPTPSSISRSSSSSRASFPPPPISAAATISAQASSEYSANRARNKRTNPIFPSDETTITTGSGSARTASSSATAVAVSAAPANYTVLARTNDVPKRRSPRSTFDGNVSASMPQLYIPSNGETGYGHSGTNETVGGGEPSLGARSRGHPLRRSMSSHPGSGAAGIDHVRAAGSSPRRTAAGGDGRGPTVQFEGESASSPARVSVEAVVGEPVDDSTAAGIGTTETEGDSDAYSFAAYQPRFSAVAPPAAVAVARRAPTHDPAFSFNPVNFTATGAAAAAAPLAISTTGGSGGSGPNGLTRGTARDRSVSPPSRPGRHGSSSPPPPVSKLVSSRTGPAAPPAAAAAAAAPFAIDGASGTTDTETAAQACESKLVQLSYQRQLVHHTHPLPTPEL